MSDGGSAQPVTPVTDRSVSAAPALRVAVVSDGRPVLGGPSQPVYVVTDNRPTQGNTPVPVVLATGVQASNIMAGPAIPVVVVSGSLNTSTPPVNTVLPVVTGTTELGATLSTTDGTWTGTAPITYTYQWNRNGTPIAAATANTYVLVLADLGTTITATVTGTNVAGNASATSAGTAIPAYLLLDRFTTNQAAPLTTPRTCQPGPGSWTIVDAGNRFSTSSQRLIGASSGGTATATMTSVGTIARATTGQALAFTLKRVSSGRCLGQFRTDNNNTCGFKGGGAGLVACDGSNGGNDPIIFTQSSFPDSDRACVVIMRPTAGGLFIVDGNLEWASAVNSTATPNAYIELSQLGTSLEADDARVATLTGIWATDWGVATNRTAAPASGATSTMTADGLVEFTWTAATGETLDLVVRSTDANNRWIVRCDQAAGNIKLFEKNAGVETQRGSTVVQTFANGTVYRITVKCVGTLISTWVQTGTGPTTTVGPTYASATFQQTATGVAVSGFATGANLACWPRTISLPNF